MSTAAADRLNEILHGANPVKVADVRIERFDMTPTVVRKRFESARTIEVNDHGMGAEQPDGSWLWVANQTSR